MATFAPGDVQVDHVQVASLGIWINVALNGLAVGDAFYFSTATPDNSVGSTNDFYFVVKTTLTSPFQALVNAFRKVDGAWEAMSPAPAWTFGTGAPSGTPAPGVTAYYADTTAGMDVATFYAYINGAWVKVYDPALDQEDSLALALVRNFGNAPAPAYTPITDSVIETGGSKKVFQFNVPADDWYTFKVEASAGTRAANFWLSTSVSEQSIQQYIDGRLSEITLLPGPPGPAGSTGPAGPAGPVGPAGLAGSTAIVSQVGSAIATNWNGGSGHVEWALNDGSGRKFVVAWTSGASQYVYSGGGQPEQTLTLPVSFYQIFSTQVTTVNLSTDSKWDDDVFYQIIGQTSPGGATSGLSQVVVIPQITNIPSAFGMTIRPHLVVYGLV
jgi:hypothetical protein